MGGVLQVSMNTPGAISNEYVIVSNDDVDAVTGSFTGLPEGSSITNKGVSFTLTYHGGDGNDISLIQQTLTPQAHIISGLKLPNGRFALTGLGAANVSYAIEASTNLVPPIVWTQIGTAVANDAGNLTFSDVGAPQYPERFYRLRNP
jgi:hypothetical protein